MKRIACLNLVIFALSAVAFGDSQDIYFTYSWDLGGAIRKIDSSGLITDVVSGVGQPSGLAFDSRGNLYFTEYSPWPGPTEVLLNKIGPKGERTRWVISDAATVLPLPLDLAATVSGEVYFTYSWDIGGAIRKIDSSGLITDVVSGVGQPSGLAFDSRGNLYFTEYSPWPGPTEVLLNRIAPNGERTKWVISDPATVLPLPLDLAATVSGDVYFTYSDAFLGGAIRKIDSSGVITDVVPVVHEPSGLAFDSRGNLYFTDRSPSPAPTEVFLNRIAPNGERTKWVISEPGAGVPLEFDLAVEPATHVLAAGVNWGAGLRGDLDADNVCGTLLARLPSCADAQGLRLGSSTTDGSNLSTFLSAFEALVEKVRAGDTIVVSFASHGDSNVTGAEPPFNTNLDANFPYGSGPMEVRTGDEYVLLSEAAISSETDRLYDDAFGDLLADERLREVRKIVIFDNCRSGGFGSDLTGGISNIAVLAACNEGYFAFSEIDGTGTGVFTNVIIKSLSEGPDGFPWADGKGGGRKDGTVTLDELEVFIEEVFSLPQYLNDPEFFGDLMGQDLPLRYVGGTGVFRGLQVEFTVSPDFLGGFDSVPEPTTLSLLALGGAVLVRRRRRT